ncbi:MAG: hypothetical protein SynsKO_11030 [Synoicihabitans sp.]
MKVLREFVTPAVDVTEATFKRFLRFPVQREFEDAMAEAAQWAREWFIQHGRPWLVATEANSTIKSLAPEQWSASENLGLLVVSAGPEAEKEASERWENDEPDRYYFLECFAAAVVDTLLVQTRDELGAKRHYSPGYPEWSISANVPLVAEINRALQIPGPLASLDSGMLMPKKSQIAVFNLPAA